MRTLAFVLAVAAALQAAPAAAQYPALGDAPTQLPAGAVPLTFHGSRFYYGIGAWYQQVVAGFVAVPDYSVLNVSGTPLFRANDVYYAASLAGYRVVPPPHEGWSALSATPPQLR